MWDYFEYEHVKEVHYNTFTTTSLDPLSLVLPQGEAGLTVSLLEELGGANVYWSPAQLSKMDAATITAAVETLGEVLDYSAEQLVVLREKAIQVVGQAQAQISLPSSSLQGIPKRTLDQCLNLGAISSNSTEVRRISSAGVSIFFCSDVECLSELCCTILYYRPGVQCQV